MGMKIWSLEKLNRMLSTMFNNETGEAPVLTQHSRTVSTASTRAGRGEADLTSLLQKEKQYGRATQEWASDMAPFRGRYVYIHDMNEETRPVMVRDYPNPEKKELGKWPQLRVNGPGRCPFLNDPVSRDQTERAAAGEQAPRTRAAAAAQQAARQDTPLEAAERRVLAENSNLARRSRSVSIQPADDHVKPLDPPKSIPIKRGSTDTLPMFGSAQASLRHHPRFAGGEPVASGVQPSNITSAIRSQMISSTAAAPGAKTGGTKELNRLKRQVLERNAAPSANSMTSSHMNEIRAAINNDRSTTSKASKRKGQDLAHIREEEDAQSEEEAPPRRAPVTRKKKAVEKELKPGYCENCRVKFNDFDEVCLNVVQEAKTSTNGMAACRFQATSQVRHYCRQLDSAGRSA
jgi:regulatory subunit for Cdc7p protein kinase